MPPTKPPMSEQWKPVAGYEGLYEVSSLGRVRSIASGPGRVPGRILKVGDDGRGYPKVTLCKGGVRRTAKVYRLVAEAFLGLQEGLDVNHRNGDKKDCSVSNLEWMSRGENLRHAYSTGLSPRVRGAFKLGNRGRDGRFASAAH